MKGGITMAKRLQTLFLGLIMILGFVLYFTGCTSIEPVTKSKESAPLPRAFEGAPPLVPHEIEEEMGCLDCHRLGDSGAPITPHPERANCVQCHIPQKEGVKPFVENTF